MTTNYWLRPRDTWSRREIVQPGADRGIATDLTGISGAHRRAYETLLAQFAG
jgi:hypothetical protein